jgi:hypothetical protein
MGMDKMSLTDMQDWLNVTAMVIVVFALAYIFHHVIYIRNQKAIQAYNAAQIA